VSREDDEPARATAEAVARLSYGKLVAFLAARTSDVASAEDALADAFAAALTDWPASGIPERPEAWLMAVARRKLVNAARRRRTSVDAALDLRLMAEELEAAATSEAHIPDDRLALMFACAHPAIEPAIRAPLILQTVLGFDAATIASAFLIAPTTMGQRFRAPRPSSNRPAFHFACPSVPTCANVSMTCSKRSMRCSPKAGPTPPARRLAAAILPRKGFGWGGSWPRCCRTSLKRSACWH
jgi:RNA polymerase sigma-70 factor (ECF subfamily)